MPNPIGLLVRTCASLVLAAASVRAWAGSGFPGKTWDQVASVESAGWSGAKLAAADNFARTLQTDAYLVVQQGRIVHKYGDCDRPINIHSMRKSILSVLMGIHVDRGQVDLNKTLADLGISDKEKLSEVERKATVRQLLQARSGVFLPAAYETGEMAAARPARGSFPPGSHWYYNNWDFNALGSIFTDFTGKNVFEALQDDLAQPLQFEDFKPSRDTEFWFEPVSMHPAYIMRLSARDLARVGLLMAREGTWNDQQIVSKEWVAVSTRSFSDTGTPGRGYGYLWWVRTESQSFSANGVDGQIMVVNPARDLIFVHLVNTDRSSGRKVSGSQLTDLLKLVMDARN